MKIFQVLSLINNRSLILALNSRMEKLNYFGDVTLNTFGHSTYHYIVSSSAVILVEFYMPPTLFSPIYLYSFLPKGKMRGKANKAHAGQWYAHLVKIMPSCQSNVLE